ncbi:MAG: DUF1906 domain-containing protein [Thermaerobacter sp.]|nr:DUF1906 domain-containing protein [Thermaerobacter sp.]
MTPGLQFGVDSGAPVNTTRLDAVAKWAGTPPRWWGRYLGTGGGAATPLTASEAALLHARGVAIALVFNDVDRRELATRQQGITAAQEAVRQAKALGVPQQTTLYADIEYGWPLTAAWLIGWAQGVLAADYTAGVYLDPADIAVQRALGYLHVVKPTVVAMRLREPALAGQLRLWDALWLHGGEWTARHGDRISTPPWIHLPPSEATTQTGLWQFSGPSCSGMVDLNLLDPAATPAPILWTR